MEYRDVPLWVVQQRAPSVAAPPHHPFSTRATLILFTEAGWQFLQDAYQVKGEIEYVHFMLHFARKKLMSSRAG